MLAEEADPVLNDLDCRELVPMGMTPAAPAVANKPVLRVATIDNYRGEESDIVIVSLTRSNHRAEVGFMATPERLNVLITRARYALIMIGNADTFLRNRESNGIWQRFIELLKASNQVYDGFPIKCERHADRKAILTRPDDFEAHCLDGGCPEPCGVMLHCGKHVCPRPCHAQVEHASRDCTHVTVSKCRERHQQTSKCHENLEGACQTCKRQDEALQYSLQRQNDHQAELDAGRKQRELWSARLRAMATSATATPRLDASPSSCEVSTLDTPSANGGSEPDWREADDAGDCALPGGTEPGARKEWEAMK